MIKFILMDIEGTTSDIQFVKKVLFPYSARELRNFVSQNKNNPVVRQCLHDSLQGTEKSSDKYADEEAILQLLQWIKDDVKHPALKILQGMIWKKGYATNVYKAHLYDDVLPTWKKWQTAGLQLGIYSSGSVAAQTLFFKYSVAGDILSYLRAHFDLAIGSKREKSSYAKIADCLHLPASNIMFLSDIPEELDAATAAGMLTGHVVRPGTQTPKHPKHPIYKDFSVIPIELGSSTK